MIKEEAEFWSMCYEDAISQGFSPDLEKPFRAPTVKAIWDDSELNIMIRGKYINKILDYCSHKRDSVCLELCCGMGMLSLAASRRGAKVTGIDVSKRAIEIADSYARNLDIPSERLEYQICDLNSASLPKGRFDVVFAWDGLHHIAQIEHLVEEVKRSLKDGGVFVVHDHAAINSRLENFVRLGLAAAFYLMIPSESGFRVRLKEVYRDFIPCRKPPSIHNHQCLDSPFEDVSGENIVQSILGSFNVLEFERYMSLPESLYARVGRDPKDCMRNVGLLRKFDRLLINLHILHPEYFFIAAEKKALSSDARG